MLTLYWIFADRSTTIRQLITRQNKHKAETEFRKFFVRRCRRFCPIKQFQAKIVPQNQGHFLTKNANATEPVKPGEALRGDLSIDLSAIHILNSLYVSCQDHIVH